MDYRIRILAAIDRLQARSYVVDAEPIAMQVRAQTSDTSLSRVQRELRAMAKAGLVVYDRRASGWRRA